MIYFTADQHFGHAVIIKYCDRPFDDVHQMDNELIERWNGTVRDNDTIFVVGDFTLRGREVAADYFLRLNGNITVLPGSHDGNWWGDHEYRSANGKFVILEQPIVSLKIRGYTPIVLCHYAMRTWEASHHGSYHLFGHSHGRLPVADKDLMMDVGVDVHGFRPISIDYVEKYMRRRK